MRTRPSAPRPCMARAQPRMIGATVSTRASPCLAATGMAASARASTVGASRRSWCRMLAPVEVASTGVGVIQGLHQRPRVPVLLEGLVRAPERPERVSEIETACDPRVHVPVAERQTTMLGGIVEGQHLLAVRTGRGEVAQKEQGDAEGEVGFHEEPRVTDSPG